MQGFQNDSRDALVWGVLVVHLDPGATFRGGGAWKLAVDQAERKASKREIIWLLCQNRCSREDALALPRFIDWMLRRLALAAR